MGAFLAAGDPLIDLTGAATSAGAEITTQVGAVLPIALPIAGGLLAVGIGWRLFRRFVKA